MLSLDPKPRRARSGWFAASLVLLVCGAVTVLAQAVPQGDKPVPAVATVSATPARGTVPIVLEHRYTMSAKIRPLLLFWIGKSNIGGARIRWRSGEDGAKGYDILIGSDPQRAPREVNRWGFILEEVRGDSAATVGVIKKSEEKTLDAAKAGIANEGANGFYFKMINGRSDSKESVATVTLTRVGKDFSYHDLDALFDAFAKFPGTPTVKRVPMPPGGRHGFLLALADMLHDSVASAKRGEKNAGKKAYPYAYYGYQYDLTRTSTEVQRNVAYGGKTYPAVVRMEAEVTERGDNWKEYFVIAVGLDGPLAEIPVYVAYQPRWWLKAEMTLDEREVF